MIKMMIFSNQKDVFLMFLILSWLKGKQKKTEMHLSFLLGFLLFPEIPATSETHVHKKVNPQHNREIKMSRIMVFCSDRETDKTPRKLVFRLKSKIKMLRNSKIVQEISETKMQRKFHTAKISCHLWNFCWLSGKQFFCVCKINL